MRTLYFTHISISKIKHKCVSPSGTCTSTNTKFCRSYITIYIYIIWKLFSHECYFSNIFFQYFSKSCDFPIQSRFCIKATNWSKGTKDFLKKIFSFTRICSNINIATKNKALKSGNIIYGPRSHKTRFFFLTYTKLCASPLPPNLLSILLLFNATLLLYENFLKVWLTMAFNHNGEL